MYIHTRPSSVAILAPHSLAITVPRLTADRLHLSLQRCQPLIGNRSRLKKSISRETVTAVGRPTSVPRASMAETGRMSRRITVPTRKTLTTGYHWASGFRLHTASSSVCRPWRLVTKLLGGTQSVGYPCVPPSLGLDRKPVAPRGAYLSENASAGIASPFMPRGTTARSQGGGRSMPPDRRFRAKGTLGNG